MVRIIIALCLLLAAMPAFGAAPAAQPVPTIVRTATAGPQSLLKIGDLPAGVYLLEITPAGVVLSGPYSLVNVGPVPPPPPPPPPPPVSDLRAKLAAEIAKITAADKVQTAATLNQAITATIPAVKAGQVSKDNVTMVLALLGPTMPPWATFISILNDAVKATTTVASLGDTLQIAVDELGKVK